MAAMRLMLLLLLAWLCFAQALQAGAFDYLKDDHLNKENGVRSTGDIATTVKIGNKYVGGRRVLWMARKSMEMEEIKMKEMVKSSSAASHHHGVDKDGGLVALTADYHSPKHHPPKNN